MRFQPHPSRVHHRTGCRGALEFVKCLEGYPVAVTKLQCEVYDDNAGPRAHCQFRHRGSGASKKTKKLES